MIQVRDDVHDPDLDVRLLKRTARQLLGETNHRTASLSLALVHDALIRELNHRYRAKNRPTDVLSFRAEKQTIATTPPRGTRKRSKGSAKGHASEESIGDIVISVDRARKQAAAYDATLQNEVHRLLIHGFLHLLGHDHHETRQRAAMEAEERRLAAAIAMPWPYD